MMVAKDVTVGTTPLSLLDALGIQEGLRGNANLKLQTPNTNTDSIFYGAKSLQNIELPPNDETNEMLHEVNLRDFHVRSTAAGQILRVLVFYE